VRQPFPRSFFLLTTISLAIPLGAAILAAQAPQTAPPAKPAPARPARVARHDYPTRPPGDPARIAHGKQIFSVNCSFCHGSDARGGETGTNLVRSELVLDDQNGELITPVVQNGRLPKGMPSFPLSAADISDIAQFIHSQKLSSQAGPESAPIDILVGDATAGKAYFEGKCGTCHSITGDLAGIGSKYEPKPLQNAIVAGAAARGYGGPAGAITATVTLKSGQQYSGRLVARDAFFVSLIDAEGNRRTLPADAPGTQITVKNPLQAHIDMLATWKDSDIHNVTKYLSTIK
jgi:mono/diheme cytochrome c family protein